MFTPVPDRDGDPSAMNDLALAVVIIRGKHLVPGTTYSLEFEYLGQKFKYLENCTSRGGSDFLRGYKRSYTKHRYVSLCGESQSVTISRITVDLLQKACEDLVVRVVHRA